MYQILTNFWVAEAEEIVDSLRQIADEIEQGCDNGITLIGEWAIEEQPEEEEEEN